MKTRTLNRSALMIATLAVVALASMPASAEIGTYSKTGITTTRLSPISLGIVRYAVRTPTAPRPAPAVEARISVDLRGSFGQLAAGAVTVTGANGVTLAAGTGTEQLVVRSSGPVDVAVEASGLVDRPTIGVRGVTLPAGGGAMTVPVTVATGLIRAEATIGGQRVSGVVWLYRVDEATGAAQATACGSIGANTYAREISAGSYLAVLRSGSTTLSRVVEVTAGASRLVRLEG